MPHVTPHAARAALTLAGGDVRRAAKALGIAPAALSRLAATRIGRPRVSLSPAQRAALLAHEGDIPAAARALGVHPSTLRSRVKVEAERSATGNPEIDKRAKKDA